MKLRSTLAALALLAAAGPVRANPMTVWIAPAVYDCATATEDTVRVDVMFNAVDRPIDAASFNVIFWFVQTELEFVRAERGDLAATWSTFDVAYDGTTISINGSNPAAIPVGISGPFARLVYAVKRCDIGNNIQICPTTPGLDLAGANTACGFVSVVPAKPGTVSVESVSHTCGDPVAGDTLDVDIRVESASQPINAAGLDVTFDPLVLDYVGYRRGDLTAAWTIFDASEVGTTIRAGGFTQTPVPGGSSGVFVTLRFVAHCCDGALYESMCTTALVDDLSSMNTSCGSVTCVPLATRPSTWGHVKSLYR